MAQPQNSRLIPFGTNTKIIQKYKLSSTPTSKAKSEFPKKYKTFTKSQKIQIISQIQNLLSNNEKTNLSTADLLNQFELAGQFKVDKAIESALFVHDPSYFNYKAGSVLRQKKMRYYRKQLRNWIRSLDHLCTRKKTRIIPIGKTEEFKQRIMEALQSLKSRNFKLIRQKALKILRGYPEYYPSGINEFSRHFWYDYIKANSDVSEVYHRLPQKNYSFDFTTNDGSSSSSEFLFQSESESESDFGPEINQDHNYNQRKNENNINTNTESEYETLLSPEKNQTNEEVILPYVSANDQSMDYFFDDISAR